MICHAMLFNSRNSLLGVLCILLLFLLDIGSKSVLNHDTLSLSIFINIELMFRSADSSMYSVDI